MTFFTGLSAFPLTPTDERGCLKPDILLRHLDRIQSAGVDSIGLLGSTGSYAYLSHEERKRTVRVAADFLRGRTPMIVGVGSLRTDWAVDLARDAAAAGADGLLLAPMSYQKLGEDEVYVHFKAVAEAGGLPLCIYNNPGTTNFTFSHKLIARLSCLPNVAAVKMPLPADGDYEGELAALRSAAPASFSIGYSGDWGACAALLSGADCWFSVIAGLLPEPALALARAARAGDIDRAVSIDRAFAPLWNLFRRFGSFRVMFTIANLLDQAALKPLRPVAPLAEQAIGEVRDALDHLHGTMASLATESAR
jgi:4-hydroxy-tetrahydrodipicolinate synthase